MTSHTRPQQHARIKTESIDEKGGGGARRKKEGAGMTGVWGGWTIWEEHGVLTQTRAVCKV